MDSQSTKPAPERVLNERLDKLREELRLDPDEYNRISDNLSTASQWNQFDKWKDRHW